ncbi:PDC sensor domain-containing protein [Petroclostridium sp. X23]|uniref:PDC sensor domain-containing protein n=1 Tax=Petroclostridium sp. X23 TaxID=3045146 RepID=UPI0024ACF6DF|nr:PDC sensor domain-containing protein [Petroclostridium sp. X23]WHH57884.1 PDC sensor domain-containing protein [Petroclostridium sp. X23]
MKKKMKSEKRYKRLIDSVISNLVFELEKSESEEFDRLILQFVRDNEWLNIKCGYILSEKGIQVSNTIFSSERKGHRKGLMYYPSSVGADNSLKRYYYELINFRMNKYISDPYISHATGSVCVTVSSVFRNTNNTRYILCIDIVNDCIINTV